MGVATFGLSWRRRVLWQEEVVYAVDFNHRHEELLNKSALGSDALRYGGTAAPTAAPATAIVFCFCSFDSLLQHFAACCFDGSMARWLDCQHAVCYPMVEMDHPAAGV